jgi:hypothetical protein
VPPAAIHCAAEPVAQPSRQPSSQPKQHRQPTLQPTHRHSNQPSRQPSSQPNQHRQPTLQPTHRHSNRPSSLLSSMPMSQPIYAHTNGSTSNANWTSVQNSTISNTSWTSVDNDQGERKQRLPLSFSLLAVLVTLTILGIALFALKHFSPLQRSSLGISLGAYSNVPRSSHSSHPLTESSHSTHNAFVGDIDEFTEPVAVLHGNPSFLGARKKDGENKYAIIS